MKFYSATGYFNESSNVPNLVILFTDNHAFLNLISRQIIKSTNNQLLPRSSVGAAIFLFSRLMSYDRLWFYSLSLGAVIYILRPSFYFVL